MRFRRRETAADDEARTIRLLDAIETATGDLGAFDDVILSATVRGPHRSPYRPP